MTDRTPDPTQWRHANPILEVSDVPAAVAFYRDVFGLRPDWAAEDQIAGITCESEPIEIYLSRSDAPVPSRLSVFVDDADAALAKYQAAGADIVDPIRNMPWGMRRFTVRDPDGNLIDISHEVATGAGSG